MTKQIQEFVFAVVAGIFLMTSVACNPNGPSGTNPVSISVSPGSVKADGIETAVLSWFSRAGSCVASGDWNGSKPCSGSETVGPFTTDGTKTYNLTGDGVVATPAVLFVGAGSGGADTQTSPDGLVTITVVQRTPAMGPLVAGKPHFIKLHVVNRSDDDVHISFDVFAFGSDIPPHTETDVEQGTSSGSLSGSVPFFHLKGSYYSTPKTVSWSMEFVGWP